MAKRSAWGHEGDHVIHFRRQRLDRVSARHRHREHDPLRLLGADGVNRGTNGAAGRDTVVDEDDGTVSELQVRPASAKPAHALFEPCSLLFDHLLELVFRQTDVSQNLVGDVDLAVLGNRAHTKLRIPGDAQLSHPPYVERSPQRSGDLVGYRNAAAGECQNDRALFGVRFERDCELPSCFLSIRKPDHGRCSVENKSARREPQ